LNFGIRLSERVNDFETPGFESLVSKLDCLG
jgi:hypothetical protein